MRLTRQTRTLVFALFGVVFMTGLAWASVPLYRMFCQVTGWGGTTQQAEAAPASCSALRRPSSSEGAREERHVRVVDVGGGGEGGCGGRWRSGMDLDGGGCCGRCYAAVRRAK